MKKKATKRLALLLCFAALIFGILGTEVPAQAASRYKLNKTSVSVQKGKTYQLKSNYKGKKIKWYSQNKKVAVVSKWGKVTAKGNGTTYITCKIGKTTLKCKVSVYTVSYKLNKTSVSLPKGNSFQLTSNYKGKPKWGSQNKKVAVVDSKGKVTAKGTGTTYITCKIGKTTLKCKVSVFSAKMSVSKKTVYINKTYQLKVSGHSVSSWKSSNKKVATVSQSGRVTGKRSGTAKIYAYVGNGYVSCTITVKKKVAQPTTPNKPPVPTQPPAPVEKKPQYKYSLYLLNNYRIYADDLNTNALLYIKTDNPEPGRIKVGDMWGASTCARFADVKYRKLPGWEPPFEGSSSLITGGAAYLAPVPGGYLTCIQPKTEGKHTLTVWEVNKGMPDYYYNNEQLRDYACTKTNASVSFYAYNRLASRKQFEDSVLENAKKIISTDSLYTTGEHKDLAENEKMLLAACDYVKSTFTYPTSDFGYKENWGYIHTLKNYGEWWDIRQIDSSIGPGLLMEIASRLGVEDEDMIPRGGDEHAYVAVSINGNFYPYLTMTPYMDTGAINPDKIEYFDFSKFN